MRVEQMDHTGSGEKGGPEDKVVRNKGERGMLNPG